MDIGDLLKAFPEMNRAALCTQWREHFNKPAPDGVRKELLVRMVRTALLWSETPQNQKGTRECQMRAGQLSAAPFTPVSLLKKVWSSLSRHPFNSMNAKRFIDTAQIGSLLQPVPLVLGQKWGPNHLR